VFRSFAERLTAYQVEKSRVIAIEFEVGKVLSFAAPRRQCGGGDLSHGPADRQTGTSRGWRGRLACREELSPCAARSPMRKPKSNSIAARNKSPDRHPTNTTLSKPATGRVSTRSFPPAPRAEKADWGGQGALSSGDALRTGAPVEFAGHHQFRADGGACSEAGPRHLARAGLPSNLRRFSTNIPVFKELRAQIADLDRQISAEADRLARALENDARDLRPRSWTRFGASLDQLKHQAANVNEAGRPVARARTRKLRHSASCWSPISRSIARRPTRDSIGAGFPRMRALSRPRLCRILRHGPRKLPTVLIAALGHVCAHGCLHALGAAFCQDSFSAAGVYAAVPMLRMTSKRCTRSSP